MTRNGKQEYINKDQERRIQLLEEKTGKHIAIVNEELGGVKQDMAKVKTDVAWLKKSYWVIFGASVGGLVTGLLNLVFG